jgi:hypothetical protein
MDTPASSASVNDALLVQRRKNCEASARYRRKKQEEFIELQDRAAIMRVEMRRLAAKAKTLEEENSALRDLLRQHGIAPPPRLDDGFAMDI